MTKRPKKLAITDINKRFADKLLLEARFPNDPECPQCHTNKPYTVGEGERFKCRSCRRKFTATSGTLLSSQKMTNISLVTALYAFCAALRI